MRRLLAAVALLAGALGAVPAGMAPAQAVPRPEAFPTSGDLVEWAYLEVLNRSPDPSGLAFWRGHLDRGGDPVELLHGLLASPELDAWLGQIVRTYRSAFARGPDLDGLRFWLQGRGSGSSFGASDLLRFVLSPEFDALYGSTDDAEFVRRVYVNALGREPDAAGAAHWQQALRTRPRHQVLFEISETPEHRARRGAEVHVVGAYVLLLGRLPDAAAAADPVPAIWSSPELGRRLPTVPSLSVSTVLDGLSVPWGLAFAPDGTMLLTQRPGALTVRLPDGTVRDLEADLDDVRAESEGGLLDVVLDRDFASNRRFYTCQNRTEERDVAVVSWRVDDGWTTATRTADPLLGGIPSTSGRHSGCRLAVDPVNAGVLYVATGDAAIGSAPQDLTSLGGKLLRISVADGEGVESNPFLSSPDPNTRRIVEWGHRNLQGLAVHPLFGGIVTVEHGPDRDDEINRVVFGGNFGWNPQPGGYNESVPMTDRAEFPDAVAPIWSSGSPTVATSGANFLVGCQWGAYADHLAVATLNGRHLRIHSLGRALQDLGSVRPGELDGDFGRLRTVVQGPDGALYVTTSNGSDDRVLRVEPRGGRCGQD